jgi:hypothetical protein
VPMTRDEIEAGRTPAGGFTKAQLAKWGVPWPPPKGWKKALLGTPGESAEKVATAPPKGRIRFVRVNNVWSSQKAIPGYTDVAVAPSMIKRYVYQVE